MTMEQIVGFLTILISTIGMFIAFKHFAFYRSSDNELSKRISRVFLTDGLIYVITLAFGVWAYMAWPFDVALWMQWMRIPILILNVVASVMLFRHYQQYK